jgi:hypothetical protein
VVLKEGYYILQESGVHSEELSPKNRSNSAMSATQEDAVLGALVTGAKPSQSRAQLTTAAEAKLVQEGKNPLQHKRDEGGLLGASLTQNTY